MHLKRNLFITGTPYQFISAFSICRESYATNEYENIIYYVKSEKTDYEVLETITDFNGEIIRFKSNSWVDLIKNLEYQSFYRFFFFQENTIYNKYLAYKFKKKGTIICLGPDGSKPYGLFTKKHELLSMFKDTLSDYKLLKSKQLKLPTLIWSTYYRYGSLKLLDEVWIQYPELYNAKQNKTKAKIIKMPQLKNQNLELLADVFSFKDTQLKDKQNVILYFNQPFFTKALVDKEFEILSQIQKRFPEKNINIKLHPGTNPSIKERMLSIPYLNIINDKMPAEFYLGMVSNSIIITGWSAAIMHDIAQQNNKSYYLYPIYKKTNDKVLSQMTFLGFPHIQMIDSIQELDWKY